MYRVIHLSIHQSKVKTHDEIFQKNTPFCHDFKTHFSPRVKMKKFMLIHHVEGWMWSIFQFYLKLHWICDEMRHQSFTWNTMTKNIYCVVLSTVMFSPVGGFLWEVEWVVTSQIRYMDRWCNRKTCHNKFSAN